MINALIYRLTSTTIITLLILSGVSFPVSSQIRITGNVVDSADGRPLAYANIGIREKNVGTISLHDGRFSITVPSENIDDTLTVSLVGCQEATIPVRHVEPGKPITVRLTQKVTTLSEVVIPGERFVEKKYGIRTRGLIHFTDGIFKEDDSFEIGQLIRLGNSAFQITSVNLHINAQRSDSASFRINFYRYDEEDNRPTDRIVEKNILQRHAIREGWLKFDLTEHNILLKGKVFVAIEFIPENKAGIAPISYEVKIGGTSKSFFRRASLGQWIAPPHHYCLYATALVDKRTPDDPEDVEAVPAITMKSATTAEPFSIFIRLPESYNKNTKGRFPVIYHLDGNAFFDAVASSADRLRKKKRLSVDPIIVGIGYANAYLMDSLRNRDYTFPVAALSDSFHVSGGGENFYQFIRTTLKPYIDRTYRTDTANNTIMGHSLGGYFVLYTLLRDLSGSSLFNNYVAASPSISYGDNYVMHRFQDISHQRKDDRKIKLYLTTGEMEIEEDPGRNFNALGKLLTRKDLIIMRVKVYEKLEHMGTAIPSFEDGIEFVLSD